MKRTLFLLAFALMAGRGFSQNVDSLLTVKAVDSLLTTANQLRSAGKYQEALPFAQQAADISKQQWGENNAVYAGSLHGLASICAGLRQTGQAKELYLKAIDLRAKVLGKEHPDYALSLHNLAILYRTEGDYDKAEPLFLEAIEIRAKVLGKEHSDYAKSMNSLANLYSDKGDYTKAESMYLEAKGILVKVLGTDHPDYAVTLNNLASLYRNKGDYAKAEQLHLQAKAIREKVLGKEHPNYAWSLNNLANLYALKGDYDKAEQLHLEAKAIREKVLGKEHPDYAFSLNNLANLYMDKGDYAKAEPLFLEAKERLANTLGKEHPNYALSLQNLALLYYKKGDYAKAEPLYLAAKETWAKALGKEHSDYSICLNNLANLYYNKGDYAKAEPLFLEAKEIRAKALGKEHPDYAESLNNLACLARSKGDYAKAEPLFLEAEKIIAKALGTEHPTYPPYLENLVILYQAANRIPESAALFLKTDELNRRLIEKSAAYSSESQMLAYLHTFEGKTAQFYSFSRSHPSPELSRASFDNALFFNGLLLENARRLARAVNSADSLTSDAYERWESCRRRLANEYAEPIAERQYVAEVETEAEGYEKTLTRNLPTFSETRRTPHWQDVQATLKPGSAAVEFIHYRYYSPKPTDSIMYAALILRPLSAPARQGLAGGEDLSKEGGDTGPQFVPLFEEKELTHLLRGATGGSNFLKINALYNQKPLYDLIWKPLEKLLKGSKTVYFAPSGLLHRINLAAVPTADGQVYGERRQLVVLGSTRQLVIHNNSHQTSTNDAYLVGGIRYDTNSTINAYANRGTSLRGLELAGTFAFKPDSLSITRGGVLDYLPATTAEVREIVQTLSSVGIQAKVDTGFYATEEAFRQLGVGASSPRIVHLATHGYFFPDPIVSSTRQLALGNERELVFKMSEHPMIRSGLILAGAKQAWLTGKHPEGREDGILTAYEISQMNLSGTELVVLSACETGLGDIVGNEGVYGLQRAFKIAGAKYLVMSLWKVDDRSTRAFMTAFYRHWLTEQQSVPQAFRTTQREMRKAYPSAYDWAGFVLIE